MSKIGEKGFSLVEIIVAAAALGGLSLVVMNLTKTMSKNSVKYQFDTELNLITNEIIGILADPAKCSTTLLGKNALNAIDISSIKNNQYYVSSHVSAPAKGYGNGGVIINSYALSATNAEVSDKTSNLLINFQNKKILGGVTTNTKKLKLYVEVDSGNLITACHSITNHSPDIWTRGASTDIFYSGNVGIGTSTPKALLELTRDLTSGAQFRIGDGANANSFGTISYTAFGNGLDFSSGSHWNGSIWKANQTKASHIVVGTNGITFATQDNLTVGGTDPRTGRMHILDNGNVGIGTQLPTSLFEVQKDFFGIINTNAAFIGGFDAGFTKSGLYVLQKDNASFVSPGSALINVVQNNVSKLIVTGQGRVGINTDAPDEVLVVTNGVSTGKYTSSGWTHISDQRFKYDINPLEHSLEKILQIQGVEFKFKNDLKHKKQIGLIAQTVEPIFPEVVLTDKKGVKSMVYSNLVAPLIEAVKTLYFSTSDLKSDLAIQNDRISKLEKAVVELENKNNDLIKLNEELRK